MVFSSTIFLFGFLPLVLALYFLPRRTSARNHLLLLASLFFYAWGEGVFVAILLLSIALNYAMGLWIERAREGGGGRRVLGLAVAANLLLLCAFKYANFVVDNLNRALPGLGLERIDLHPVHLPIGISFFTFQALTYVADVYRRDAPVQRSPLRLALYISLFPQLIAGPIVRYREVAARLRERGSTREEIADGIGRFVVGLAKKVLVANSLAVPADRIFALPAEDLHAAVAWLGALCYALQIYFDFSGYSDMAIGLGRVFGFRFPENFRYPYASRSVREFWRRWHITLSTFFRDYLFIPLGGSRGSEAKTHANLLLVFLLCGLWHGASWTFVVWGLLHGGFMLLERGPAGAWLERGGRPLQHAYVVLALLVTWVFFRAESLSHATELLAAMAGLGRGTGEAYPLILFLDAEVLPVLAIAIVGSLPWLDALRAWRARRLERETAPLLRGLLLVGRVVGLNALLLASAMSLAAGTHNPFIYFRF